MKMKAKIALAVWLLEHFTFGDDREALCGDLLEQLQSGRSAGWFWGEVLIAIVGAALRWASGYALCLGFSAGWSALYPAWEVWGPSRFSAAVLLHTGKLEWPLSALALLGQGIIPVITFVWLGMALFLLMCKEMWPRISIFRWMNGLSCSLLTLFIGIFCMPKALKCVGLDCIAKPGFFSAAYLSAINVPVALSVFVAILCVLPREKMPPRRRRRSPVSETEKLKANWGPEMTRPA